MLDVLYLLADGTKYEQDRSRHRCGTNTASDADATAVFVTKPDFRDRLRRWQDVVHSDGGQRPNANGDRDA